MHKIQNLKKIQAQGIFKCTTLLSNQLCHQGPHVNLYLGSFKVIFLHKIIPKRDIIFDISLHWVVIPTHVSLLFSKWYYISEFSRECLHHVLWFFHAKEVNTNIRKLMYTIKNYLLIDLECRLFLFRMLFGNLYLALSSKYFGSYRHNI